MSRKFVLWTVLVAVCGVAAGNKPVFDLSNSMRLVLLPADTPVGSVIYKLRASDADDEYPLTFRATGVDGSLIGIQNVDCTQTICSADVILKRPLSTEGEKYALSLEAKDTAGDRTLVQTEIHATRATGAFKGAPHVVRLPETTPPDALVASFVVKENENLFRGVNCQLLPSEDQAVRRHFVLTTGIPTATKDETRCDLRVREKLDYESRASYVLQVVAENAWADTTFDTRNVAVHTLVIEVTDVQDTKPYFLRAPPVTRLPETAKEGDEVLTVSAFDGDYAHPRRIRYGLDPSGLAFSSYFSIDPDTGVLRVRKELQNVERRPTGPVILRVVAEELTDEDEERGIAKLPAEEAADLRAEVEVAIVIDDVINRKPKFLQNHYITSLEENAAEGTKLEFEGGLDIVEDLDKGENGVLELFIEGSFADTFEVSPSVVENSAQFVVSVKNSKKIDYEEVQTIEFKIVAREVGSSDQLYSSALVTVNLVDRNDNLPVFERDKYEVDVHENEQNGKVVLKVLATDADLTAVNHEVRYSRFTGDDPIISALRLDPMSGEISIANGNLIDRERMDRHVIGVQAVNRGTPSAMAEATVSIRVMDANDQKPRFLKRKYQGFMNAELTRLRNDLQVEAVDGDAPGGKNSDVRYEILTGNYERKFSVDSVSGVISVKEPLLDDDAIERRRNGKQSGGDLANIAGYDVVDPVITLTVRAYDLGIPSLDSEVQVYIFTDDVFTRAMRFIIPETPEHVDRDKDKISDLISTMTGGEAQIQDIQPYYDVEFNSGGLEEGGADEDRILQLKELARIDFSRSAKTVSVQPKNSVVDVLIHYPANSVVDLGQVTSKLVSSNGTGGSLNPGGGNATTMEFLEQRNSALIGGLVALCAIIAAVIIGVLCCCFCPSCYKSRDKNSVNAFGDSDSEIRVLTVKDGQGRELREAKFVEILKEARHRIRSATIRGQSSAMRRGRGRHSAEPLFETTQRHRDAHQRGHHDNMAFQMNGVGNGGPGSVIIVKEAARGGGGPGLQRMVELDPRNLSAEEGFHRNPPLHPSPSEVGRIFEVVDGARRNSSRTDDNDVQIMQLDDDTRREEIYRRVGDSEIVNLDLDDEESGTYRESDIGSLQNRYHVTGEPHSLQVPDRQGHFRQTSSSTNEVRRTKSDADIDSRMALPAGGVGGGEFYTAVGPDGKEIILRRYLNEQGPQFSSPVHSHDRGFLNMAMVHLQQQQQKIKENFGEVVGNVSRGVERVGGSVAPECTGQVEGHRDDFGIEEQSDHDHHSRLSNVPKNERSSRMNILPDTDSDTLTNTAPDTDNVDLTPKHKINSPILEETESTLEAEVVRSRRGRARNDEWSSKEDRYRISYDNSDASVLRFRINDGRVSPAEPVFAETKASILRRRHTMAKLLEEQKLQQRQLAASSPEKSRSPTKGKKNQRHCSMNDLSGGSEAQRDRDRMKKWKSISNDELIRPQPKYSLANTRIAELSGSHVRLIPVQQAGGGDDDNTDPQQQNPRQQNQQPRKFSKYDPTKHSHGYFYGSTDGGDGGGGPGYQDGVATTLDPSAYYNVRESLWSHLSQPISDYDRRYSLGEGHLADPSSANLPSVVDHHQQRYPSSVSYPGGKRPGGRVGRRLHHHGVLPPHHDATSSSSDVPSRSSSVQSLSTSSNNPSVLHSQNGGGDGSGGGGGIGGGGFIDPARDLERMAEEGRNNRSIVDENLERNIGVTPDSATLRERATVRGTAVPNGDVVEGTQLNDLPALEYDLDRYKSEQAPDSADPHIKGAFNMGIPKDSDNTSGISSISHNHTTGSPDHRRQQLPPIEHQPRPAAQQQRRRRRRSQSGAALEKKSVFTRAYEDVRVARPNSAEVLMDE